MRIWLSALVLLSSGGLSFGQSGFVTTKVPYYNGKRLIVDLPTSQQHKNVGGADGSGLCVYTSVWHSSIWQSVRDIYGFRDWMTKRPGGSYPQKFDATLKQYCQQTKVKLPAYLQHTGGDESVLDLAMKTGRSVGVTYCGCDPNYGSNTVIGHMVNLVYLDESLAAILDNNFIGQTLWMPREEFLARWKGVKTDGTPYMTTDGFRRLPIGGGWAIILLDSPPVPYDSPPQTVARAQGSNFMIGQCSGGRCPLPSSSFNRPFQYPQINGGCSGGNCSPNSCPEGSCPLVTPLDDSTDPVWVPNENGKEWGCYKGAKCVARCFADGRCEKVDSRGNATGVPVNPPSTLPTLVHKAKVRLTGDGEGDKEVGKEKEFPEGGVDSGKLEQEVKFWHSGRVCSRSDFFDALTGDAFTDDSEKWNLAVVGDSAFWTGAKTELGNLDSTVKAKLHVKFYLPNDWQVTQFALTPGLVLRSPAVERVGKELGKVQGSTFTPGSLKTLLGVKGAPLYVPPPPPPPAPPTPPVNPNPQPVTPSEPSNPNPAPNPTSNTPVPALLIGAGALYLLWRKK